jgi:hypothetical protein
MSRALKAGLPAAVIAAVVGLCFMHKAFNIDDTTFLTMSEHMLHDPLHPASVQISQNGNPPFWLANNAWSGPVMPALLLPAVAAGGAEWAAHLVMLVVFLIGIFATAALALRLGISEAGARWAALLLATSPAVLAMAETSMPDVPVMSFGVLGAERLLAFRDERGWWRGVIAAVALTLCVLSRQHGLLLLGCFVLLMPRAWPRTWAELRALVRDRVFLSAVAAVVAAVVLVIATYAAMRDPHVGSNLASSTMQMADASRWRVNLANLPAQWVLAFPLGLAWAWLHGRRMVRSWWCGAGALVGVFLAYETHAYYRHPSWLWWQAPVTALGTAVLVDTVVDAWRRRDLIDLALAACLFIAMPIAIYSHLPPKYLVPSAPAMAILIARNVERRAVVSWRGPAVLSAFGLALGLLIIRADQVDGEIGRTGGAIVASYVQKGEHVWFDGTWGFHWYATRAGAQPVTTVDPKPAPGDIVVVGAEGWVISSWPNKKLLEKIEFNDPGGRIMTRAAGFFSNVQWGPLPWKWSNKPLRPLEVYRIE